MQPMRGWVTIVAVAAMGGGLCLWRFNAAASLRVQAEGRREALERLAEIRQENEQLRRRPAPDDGVTDTALAAARTQVATLRGKLAAENTPGTEEARLGPGARLAAADWENAGIGSPAATLETALWAAAGGDVDALTKTLTFANGAAEKAAHTWFDSLPAETRERYGSVDRLIAALSVPDVPTGSVVVNRWSASSDDQPTRFVSVQLTSPEGTTKQATLMFIRRDDEWRIGITRAVVAKYASRLQSNGAMAR